MNTNTQKVFDHLSTAIKTKLAPSPIHGIGVFAINDIKSGENIFPTWDGDSGIYILPNTKVEELSIEVRKLLDMYFINEECGYKVFRLFKGLNFISHNISYCNSAYPNKNNVNITTEGVATRDIKAGEEILEWYTQNINLEESE
jgi:SET domain-containing protein